MSTARRWILATNAAALVIWFALAAAVQSRLPAEMVTKFDISGRVVGRSATSALAWYALPAIAALLFILMAVVAHFSASRPQMFNIPEKKRLLELPDAERRSVTEMLATAMCALGLWEFAILALVHWSLYRATVDRSTGISQMLSVVMLASGAITILALGFGLVRLSEHIRNLEKRVALRQSSMRAT